MTRYEVVTMRGFAVKRERYYVGRRSIGKDHIKVVAEVRSLVEAQEMVARLNNTIEPVVVGFREAAE